MWLYGVRRLLRFGLPLRAIVTDVFLVGGRFGGWRVAYTFVAGDGREHRGVDGVPLSKLPLVGKSGDAVTVLVDPDRDNKFHLYLAVGMSYEIITGRRPI